MWGGGGPKEPSNPLFSGYQMARPRPETVYTQQCLEEVFR